MRTLNDDDLHSAIAKFHKHGFARFDDLIDPHERAKVGLSTMRYLLTQLATLVFANLVEPEQTGSN